MNVSLFISPISKNIIDAILYCTNAHHMQLGITATRRQIDNKHFYVQDTYQFVEYVSAISDITLERDHAGPLQGGIEDDGVVSIANDIECGFHIIHLDPFKAYKNITDAAGWTMKMINYATERSANVRFEIGTEAAIRPYNLDELATFLSFLHPLLDKIEYAVVQTGAQIDGMRNLDSFDAEAATEMIRFCHSFGLKTKEHNGDFLAYDSINNRFKLGLDAINIGPELGILETTTILNTVSVTDREYLIKLFVGSDKWARWLPEDSPERDKARFAGHYLYGDPNFLKIKYKYPTLDHHIINKLIKRIRTRYEATLCGK